MARKIEGGLTTKLRAARNEPLRPMAPPYEKHQLYIGRKQSMNRISVIGVFVFSAALATSWSIPAASGDDIRLKDESGFLERTTTVDPTASYQICMSDVLEPATSVSNMPVAVVPERVPKSRRRITRADYTSEELQQMGSSRRWMIAGCIVGGVSLVPMIGEYGFTGHIDNTLVAVVPALLGWTDAIVCHSHRSAIKKRVRERVSVGAGLLLDPGNNPPEYAGHFDGKSRGTGAYATLTYRW